jgi:hypothetical protein
LEAGTRRIDDLFSAKAEELSLFSPAGRQPRRQTQSPERFSPKVAGFYSATCDRAGRREQTIGERLVADQAVLRALPEAPFEPCDKRLGKVSSTALVRYHMRLFGAGGLWFSCVLVNGFVDEVAIICGASETARHPRGGSAARGSGYHRYCRSK